MAKINLPDDLPRVFDRAVREALKKTGDKLDAQFELEVTAVKWPWDRGTTVRKKNKQIVSSPRDIVDLGNLKDSKKRESIDPYGIKWTWEVDYSSIVHDGGKFMDGSDYPERPWTKDAEKEVNIQEYFEDILRRELNG